MYAFPFWRKIHWMSHFSCLMICWVRLIHMICWVGLIHSDRARIFINWLPSKPGQTSGKQISPDNNNNKKQKKMTKSRSKTKQIKAMSKTILFSPLIESEQWSNTAILLLYSTGSSYASYVSTITITIYPLTARGAGAPQMTLQPVFSIFPCFPLPSGTCQTPGLSIPWCCLPTSPSVCLIFFPLSLCLVRWFWPDLINGRHDHTTAVCVSLHWSGGLHVVQLPAGSWHGLSHW